MTAKLGVRLVWVEGPHLRSGVARQLLQAARWVLLALLTTSRMGFAAELKSCNAGPTCAPQ